MAGQHDVLQALELDHINHVGDVGVQIDSGCQKMDALAEAGERWRKHLVPALLQAIGDPPPAPAAMPGAVHQHEGFGSAWACEGPPGWYDLWRRRAMGDATVGWIAAIIIGGIAGWLAEQFMKSNMGLLMNIVLGIVGAAVASAILSAFGIVLGGWIGYLIAGFIGACLLIWIVRWIQGPPDSLRAAIRQARAK